MKLHLFPLIALLTVCGVALPQRFHWQRLTPTNPPPNWYRLAIAHDTVRDRVVLFGGFHPFSGQVSDETWELDGTVWVKRKPSNFPTRRFHHAMAFDSHRRRVVLFGGKRDSRQLLNETWEWNGTTWTQLHPKTLPPARSATYMAYDPLRRRVVLFGGTTRGGDVRDTWEWNGVNWVQQRPRNAPPRTGPMVWDPVRRRVVMFHGFTPEVWEWVGAQWIQRSFQSGPPSRGEPIVYFDTSRGCLVAGGGIATRGLTDLWELRAAGWRQRSVRIDQGFITALHAAYDERRGRAVLITSPAGNARGLFALRPADLVSSDFRVSIARPSPVRLDLDAESPRARRGYIVLGCVGTTIPGVTLGGFQLFLNVDPYFQSLLAAPNTWIQGSAGVLDASGKARATFGLPGGLPASLVGTRLYHAYLAFSTGPFRIEYASNPVPLTLVR